MCGLHIINLNKSVGPGTHWFAIHIKPDLIAYFVSFRLYLHKEVVDSSNLFNVKYLYNSSYY